MSPMKDKGKDIESYESIKTEDFESYGNIKARTLSPMKQKIGTLSPMKHANRY